MTLSSLIFFFFLSFLLFFFVFNLNYPFFYNESKRLIKQEVQLFLKKMIIEFDWAKGKLQVILSTPVRINGEEPSFSISLLLLRYSSVNGQISGLCLFRAALRYSFLSSVSLAEMEPNPLSLLSDSVLWCLPVSWLKGKREDLCVSFIEIR